CSPPFWLYPISAYAGDAIERFIERHDAFNVLACHYRSMQRIACGQIGDPEHVIPCAHDVRQCNREDLIDNPDQGIECGLQCVASTDGNVSVENFLQNLSAGDESFIGRDRRFEELPG